MTFKIIITTKNVILINIGDNTQHQDHIIIPVIFNTINTIFNKPTNSITDELKLLSLISYLLYKF